MTLAIGRDGLLVKLAPAVVTICDAYTREDLAEIAGLPVSETHELTDAVLIGRAAGAMTMEIADAMLREWREREDARERGLRRSA